MFVTGSKQMKRTISDMINSEEVEEKQETAGGPIKKKKSGTGRPRPPPRPYKRVADEVLTSRITDMEKKLDALQSKAVLLRQRLDMHVIERQLRENDPKL